MIAVAAVVLPVLAWLALRRSAAVYRPARFVAAGPLPRRTRAY